jgi:hypothetical protein
MEAVAVETPAAFATSASRGLLVTVDVPSPGVVNRLTKTPGFEKANLLID